MAASWRLVFATTYNDQTVDAFDASIQELTRLIGKAGSLRATIAIPNDEIGRRIKRIRGQEGRLSMYAYRDNVLWWGGFMDSTRIDGSETETILSVEGTTFESYLTRRESRGTATYTNMDQTQIAKFIWDSIQDSGIGSDILVETNKVGNSGVKRTWSTKRSDVRTWDSILAEISNSDDGFEWMIDTWDDGSRRRRSLHCGYPILGRPKNNWVLSFPGAIINYAVEGNALEGATSFQARGKAPDPIGVPGKKGNKDGTGGSGTPSVAQDPIMSSVYEATGLHKQGYTRMDATVDRSTVVKVSTLNEWAKAALDLRSGPLVMPEVTCRIDDLNAALIGYTVKIRIHDTAYPTGPQGEPGYEAYARVIGVNIDPGEQGYDDIVQLTFENPHSDEVLKGEVTYGAL